MNLRSITSKFCILSLLDLFFAIFYYMHESSQKRCLCLKRSMINTWFFVLCLISSNHVTFCRWCELIMWDICTVLNSCQLCMLEKSFVYLWMLTEFNCYVYDISTIFEYISLINAMIHRLLLYMLMVSHSCAFVQLVISMWVDRVHERMKIW